jgi:AcrR family transcriptional regulator
MASIFVLTQTNMKTQAARPTRPYRMTARAEATAATAKRILDATTALWMERWYDEIRLEDVAARAGVSVQTVIRRFGGRDRLARAAIDHANATIARFREPTLDGGAASAARAVFDDYERWGDAVMRLLAQEERFPVLRSMADDGRRMHREWVERTFAETLDRLPAAERRRRAAALLAATDVYVWKLLRRDLGLSRREAERALTDLIAPLAGDS